jgi:type II secretory pathway pseudopilin PulG
MAGAAYVWVLVVVALTGLGLAAAAEVYLTGVQRDKERELLFVGNQFRAAIARYRETRLAGGRQEYPPSLDDLLQDQRFPDLRRYLRKVHHDPVNGGAEWGVVRVAGRIVGVHSLSDRMPIKVDGFDTDNASFRGKQKYSEWVFTHPPDLLIQEEKSQPESAPAPTPTRRSVITPSPAPTSRPDMP